MANDFEDIISFGDAGLNWDDDLLSLPPNDARYRENVVISDESNYGVYTNVLGNLFKDAPVAFSYPAGDLKVIGFIENKEDRAGIFFVYSSTGENSIIQYKSVDDELEYILDGTAGGPGNVGTVLNFQEDVFIDAGVIGNQDDKYLVWTDGVNEPRIVNIALAQLAVGSPYYPISGNLIRFYKAPYLEEIELSYLNDSTKPNNLQGSLWQFAIRKNFIDNTYSVLSPYSSVLLPNEEEFPNAIFTDKVINNVIDVDGALDPDDDILKSYELFYRKVDIGSGTPGSWYSYDTEEPGLAAISFRFYNDQTDTAISDEEGSRIYDYVPDLSDHMAIIDSNRVVFGGITEGYVNLPVGDLDVTLTNSLEIATGDGVVSNLFQFVGGSPAVIDVTKSTASEYNYQLTIDSSDVEWLFTYNKTSNDVAVKLTADVNALGGGLGAVAGADSVTITGATTCVLRVFEPTTKYNSFKNGSSNFFGIQYLNEGKPTSVQTSGLFVVDVPNQDEAQDTVLFSGSHTGANNVAVLTDGTKSYTVNELVGLGIQNTTDGSHAFITANTSTTITALLIGGTDDDWDTGDSYTISYYYLNFYNKVSWDIDHDPPVDATHYQWMYLGSNYDYYEQYVLDETQITIDGSYMEIDKSIITNFVNAYGDSINYGFDIQAGDRVRFIGYFEATISATSLENIYLFDDRHDFRVEEVTSTYIKIADPGENWLPVGFNYYYCIEVYRLRNLSEDAGIYQATSPILELYDDAGTLRHRGITQDQTSILPATGDFNPYYTRCVFQYNVFVNVNNSNDYTPPLAFSNGWRESVPVSLAYDSAVSFYGKVNVVNEYSTRQKYNKIRWGGKFLDDSGVNFMTKFDFDDEKVMDDRNGLINVIEQIGDTLKVYQERKVNSLYLKTTSSTGADGGETYVFNPSQVMSDVRQSVTDYGCTHFSSYVKTVRNAYFFDFINATVIRDTPGGLIPIGDLKMETYFRQKVLQIQAHADPTQVIVLGGYDEYLKMYVLTFKALDDSNSPINDTIGFNELANRWISFYSYLPEYYGKISGDTAISFLDGELYLHNKSQTRNNFYTTQYDSRVDISSKGNPKDIKVWNAIEIHSTGQWAPSEEGDVEINIPILMQSRLKKGKFELQEGVYNSEFLKDALDGGVTFDIDNLQNGRELRGSEMIIKLRNDDTTEANLRLVKVRSIISH